jgi:hypothetical protein
MNSFRFPEGVEFGGEDDNGNVVFRVSIPLDDDGHFGRQCPGCRRLFRVAYEDYDRLPEDLRLWCVYCGRHDDHSEFLTEQQRERAIRAGTDYGEQVVGQMLDRAFKGVARRSRNSMFSISYRSTPFHPSPLPSIDEERLVRERVCEGCNLHYAVFGEHRFCPVCGPLPPLVAALDALGAEVVRLDALGAISADAQAALREQGVLDRTYVDTIKNLVGIVEALAERVFRQAVASADEVLKGKGKIFQRLDDWSNLFVAYGLRDPRVALGDDWHTLQRTWAARHVFTHCDGIVDDRYLASVPGSRLQVGQRLRVTEAEARAALHYVEQACRAIASSET